MSVVKELLLFLKLDLVEFVAKINYKAFVWKNGDNVNLVISIIKKLDLDLSE